MLGERRYVGKGERGKGGKGEKGEKGDFGLKLCEEGREICWMIFLICGGGAKALGKFSRGGEGESRGLMDGPWANGPQYPVLLGFGCVFEYIFFLPGC